MFLVIDLIQVTDTQHIVSVFVTVLEQLPVMVRVTAVTNITSQNSIPQFHSASPHLIFPKKNFMFKYIEQESCLIFQQKKHRRNEDN